MESDITGSFPIAEGCIDPELGFQGDGDHQRPDTYIHVPLQTPHSIRLLRLLPALNRSSPIECQIFDYPLQPLRDNVGHDDDDNDIDHTHLYEALSYVWGPVDPACYISIVSGGPVNPTALSRDGDQGWGSTGSKAMRITPNLHAALLRLRNRYLDRVFWIDAVCINQKNGFEKGHQISRMAEIYHLASGVIVWLGENHDDEKDRNDSDRKATGENRVATVQGGGAQALLDLGALPDLGNITPHLNGIGQIKTNLAGFERLLGRSWFKRIWVLQEVAAGRKISIKCGGVELDGDVFCRGLEALRYCLPTQYLQTRPVAALIRRSSFRHPLHVKNTPGIWSGGPNGRNRTLALRPLGELLYMYQGHQATEQRDKIFALLGLARENDSGSIEKHLLPNYSMSWTQLLEKLLLVLLGVRLPVHVEFRIVTSTTETMTPHSVTDWGITSLSGEFTLVKAECFVVGKVRSVFQHELEQEPSDTVQCCIHFEEDFESLGAKGDWTLPPSPNPVCHGDLVFLPRGATSLVIARPRGDFFSIILFPEIKMLEFEHFSADRTYQIQLVWDWEGQLCAQGVSATFRNGYLSTTSFVDGRKLGADELWSHFHLIQEAASVLFETGSYSEAVVLLGRLVKLLETRFGDGDLHTLGAVDSFARACLRLGGELRYQARNLMAFVVQRRATLQGSEHPSTLFSRLILVATCNPISNPYRNRSSRELEDALGVLKNATLHGSSPRITEEGLQTLLRCFDELAAADLLIVSRSLTIRKKFVLTVVQGNYITYRRKIRGPQLEVWWKIMDYLLNLPGNKGRAISVTASALRTAIRFFDGDALGRWLDMLYRSGANLKITQEILLSAVNWYDPAFNLMEYLIERFGKTFTITEHVVVAAVEKWWPQNSGDMKPALDVMLEMRWKEIPMTDNVPEAAERNNPEVIKRLLRDGEGNPARMITETMILQAASRERIGVLTRLLESNVEWRHVEINDALIAAVGRKIAPNYVYTMHLMTEYRGMMAMGII
ncbi:Heterokaryon incompatibility protein (HET) domain containing protein [Naviculisporaceae sp. PSN 640]